MKIRTKSKEQGYLDIPFFKKMEYLMSKEQRQKNSYL